MVRGGADLCIKQQQLYYGTGMSIICHFCISVFVRCVCCVCVCVGGGGGGGKYRIHVAGSFRQGNIFAQCACCHRKSNCNCLYRGLHENIYGRIFFKYNEKK